MLEKYKKDEMAPVELVSFRAKTKALLKATPRQADISIAAPYSASQTIVQESVQPSLIIIDEAARATESELWPLLAFFRLIGDHYQLTPVVLSTPNTSSSQSITESIRGTISKRIGS